MKRFSALLLAVLMSFSLFSAAVPIPAKAAETVSEFDFSAVDTAETYANYPKKESPDGINYVEATLLNQIDTTNQKNFADYRYGAYLLGRRDRHYYSISNRNYGGKIPSNILTIYADSLVRFRVIDEDGLDVIDNERQYDFSTVKYYNKTQENGHSVYYIEFSPEQSTFVIEFKTSSDSAQQHYSFWFGHPLTRSGSGLLALASVAINKPETDSDKFGFYISSVPRKAWLTRLWINKTKEFDRAYVSNAYLSVFTPNTTTAASKQSTDSNTIKWIFDVNRYTATPAFGTYDFFFTNVTWNKNVSGPALYEINGNAYISYVYPFGA